MRTVFIISFAFFVCGFYGVAQGKETRGHLIERNFLSAGVIPAPGSESDSLPLESEEVEYVPSEAEFDAQVEAAAISRQCSSSPSAVKRTTVRRISTTPPVAHWTETYELLPCDAAAQ